MRVTEHIEVTDQMKRDLASDGAIVVRGLFTREQLTRVRESFDYGIAHPSPQHGMAYAGTDDEHFNDYGNPRTARCTSRRSRSWDSPISLRHCGIPSMCGSSVKNYSSRRAARPADHPGTRTPRTCPRTGRTCSTSGSASRSCPARTCSKSSGVPSRHRIQRHELQRCHRPHQAAVARNRLAPIA